MKTFIEILKDVRKQAGLTQAQLAKRIGVSTILISMVESGQKQASKSLIVKLARAMDVHPSSIAPFMLVTIKSQPSKTETLLVRFMEKLQELLIEDKSQNLRR